VRSIRFNSKSSSHNTASAEPVRRVPSRTTLKIRTASKGSHLQPDPEAARILRTIAVREHYDGKLPPLGTQVLQVLCPSVSLDIQVQDRQIAAALFDPPVRGRSIFRHVHKIFFMFETAL
jgi:hypothetical protein